MHSTRPGKIFTLALLAALILWAGIDRERETGYTDILRQSGAEAHARAGDTAQADSGPDIESANIEDLRALMIDLAAFRACGYLQGRILTLSSGGASSPADRRTVTGNFWIDSCNTEQTDPGHLRISISGKGWRWISRQRQRLGAEFELDEYVKFLAQVTMVGTFDMAYARQDHIVTVWFVPTRPVEVDFQIQGDVDVDTESLWSSIMGQGAEILGGSPEERARQDITKKASRRFRSRLSSGLTLIIDLCTGQRYTRFGTFPAGQLPDQAPDPKERPLLAHNNAVLHRNGILMSGPFETDKPVIARLEARDGGEAHAAIVCQDDARRIADSYVNGNNIPQGEALAEAIFSPGSPARIEVPPNAGCPVVLVIRPVDGQTTPLACSFLVYHEGAEQNPLVKCR